VTKKVMTRYIGNINISFSILIYRITSYRPSKLSNFSIYRASWYFQYIAIFYIRSLYFYSI